MLVFRYVSFMRKSRILPGSLAHESLRVYSGANPSSFFGLSLVGCTRPDNKKWRLLALSSKLDVPSDITTVKASKNN